MKKHLVKLLFILPLFFAATACDSKDDAPQEQPVNPYNKFKGTWAGTYTGEAESGTWTATFDDKGKATGKLVSNSGNTTFNLTGQVTENGEINAEYTNSTTVVGKMEGTMTAATASGTWESPLLKVNGTWSGTKN